MNKKAQLDSIWNMLLIVGGLMVLIFVGIMFAMGSSILNWTFDIAIPEFDNLGMVGDTNATQISEITLHPVNSIVQSMNWFGGIIYVFGILGLLGLAFVYRTSSQKWLIPLFFGLMLILIISSIFLSNIYQDIYTGTDEFALGMQEQTLLSWLIIYSPMIVSIVGFIAGAIMFSGANNYE